MSVLHVSLIVFAQTAVTTDPSCRFGPRIRIGDDTETVDLSLPNNTEAALAFLTRLSATVAELASTITEHGTAYTPESLPR